MTIQNILNNAVEKLKTNNIENSLFEANILLCHVLGENKLFLVLNRDKELEKEDISMFNNYIEKRIKRIPLQYITGCQEFMSLNFFVNENVLIPRQDTETIVEYVLEDVRTRNNNQVIRILDIGCGSGCISVSLAHYIEDVEIIAVDISEKALETAKKNAYFNNVSEKINFYLNNVFNYNFNDLFNFNFDYVISNPPYIPTETIVSLEKQVKDYEPKLALDGGESGLDFYYQIAKKSSSLLKNKGKLVLEVGHNQSNLVCEIIRNTNQFENIKKIEDLLNIERVISAIKK